MAFYPSFSLAMFRRGGAGREGLVSAFNYRKKQQQRRSVPAVVGRSEGGGGKGMKGETRIVFALNPAAVAQLTRLYRIIKPHDGVKAREEGGRGGEGNGVDAFYAKICWIFAKVADVDFRSAATPASRGFNRRKLHARLPRPPTSANMRDNSPDF